MLTIASYRVCVCIIYYILCNYQKLSKILYVAICYHYSICSKAYTHTHIHELFPVAIVTLEHLAMTECLNRWFMFL